MIKPTINTFFAHHNISVWLLLFMFSFPAHAQSITIVRSSTGHNIGSSLQTHTEPQYNAQYVVGQLIASSSISVDNYKIAHGFIQPLIHFLFLYNLSLPNRHQILVQFQIMWGLSVVPIVEQVL